LIKLADKKMMQPNLWVTLLVKFWGSAVFLPIVMPLLYWRLSCSKKSLSRLSV